MFPNVFLDNSIQNCHSSRQISDHTHSCPFCRCRSTDNSINIKVQSKPACSFNILLGKDFLEKKTKYSKNDQKRQNVYYRNFDSPQKKGLSPNGSKKIVIQYLSPQHNQQSEKFFKPLFQLQNQQNQKKSRMMSSPSKLLPKNIYTNENTPPKAKFLQRRSSRKNSQDRILDNLSPVKGITLVQSQKVPSPMIIRQQFNKLNQNKDKLNHLINKDVLVKQTKQYQNNKDNDISPIGKIFNISQFPHTSSKNLIQGNSSPKDSYSPYHSLESTPQIIPYGNFSSTPLLSNNSSNKKRQKLNKQDNQKVNPSINEEIKEIRQFKQQQYQSLFTPKQLKQKLQNKLFQEQRKLHYQSAKLIQTPTKQGDRFNYEKFDKTLNKQSKSAQKNSGNNNFHELNNKNYNSQIEIRTSSNPLELNYKKNTIENKRQSIGKVYQEKQTNNYKINNNSVEQNQNIENKLEILNENGFYKKLINFDQIQISDNFKTPKSKYKRTKQTQIIEDVKQVENIQKGLIKQQNKQQITNPNYLYKDNNKKSFGSIRSDLQLSQSKKIYSKISSSQAIVKNPSIISQRIIRTQRQMSNKDKKQIFSMKKIANQQKDSQLQGFGSNVKPSQQDEKLLKIQSSDKNLKIDSQKESKISQQRKSKKGTNGSNMNVNNDGDKVNVTNINMKQKLSLQKSQDKIQQADMGTKQMNQKMKTKQIKQLGQVNMAKSLLQQLKLNYDYYYYDQDDNKSSNKINKTRAHRNNANQNMSYAYQTDNNNHKKHKQNKHQKYQSQSQRSQSQCGEEYYKYKMLDSNKSGNNAGNTSRNHRDSKTAQDKITSGSIYNRTISNRNDRNYDHNRDKDRMKGGSSVNSSSAEDNCVDITF